MNQIRCINCGFVCQKYGKTKAGTQRWFCTNCRMSFTNPIDSSVKHLQMFLNWLFSKDTQSKYPGNGRTFRRQTAQCWNIWPMPPKIESPPDVVYVDGIYLDHKVCVLICCDNNHVLGWYVCRYERAMAWEALMERIATPKLVVSDGGPGFQKALKKVWHTARLQRCIFHAFCQVKRYTTTHPKTQAGRELYRLAVDLLHIKKIEQAMEWVKRLAQWRVKHRLFLMEMSRDENGTLRPTHERLIRAEHSLVKLIQRDHLFTYLDDSIAISKPRPSTNNRIEGGVNAQLREMLHSHRGLSVMKQIKAVFWWCYMHSPRPLSLPEILRSMPTDASISDIYTRMNETVQLKGSIPTWGDAIVWGDLHNYDEFPSYPWD